MKRSSSAFLASSSATSTRYCASLDRARASARRTVRAARFWTRALTGNSSALTPQRNIGFVCTTPGSGLVRPAMTPPAITAATVTARAPRPPSSTPAITIVKP